MDAALRCFSTKGMLHTGIEAIRLEADANPSSVYHLFGDLDGIVAALLARTFERLADQLRAQIAPTTTAELAVKALVRAQVDWALAHPDEGRFLYQALALEMAPPLRDRVFAHKAIALAPVIAHMQRFVDTAALPPWDPIALEVAMLGATHEACRRKLFGAPLSVSFLREALPMMAWASVASGLSTTMARA